MTTPVAHAFSVWPTVLDFNVFEAYVAGLSAQECTSEFIQDFRKQHDVPRSRTSSPTGRTPLRLPSDAGLRAPDLVRTHSVASLEASLALQKREARVASPSSTTKETFPESASVSDLQKSRASRSRSRRRLAAARACATAPLLQITEVNRDLLRQDFEMQLAYFEGLENDEEYFATPYSFVSDHTISISMEVRRELVARYYALNPVLVKHAFGLRLGKNEIEQAEVTFENLFRPAYIRRHLDNMRRVHKYLTTGYKQKEGLNFSRDFSCVDAIEQYFQLPTNEAQTYAALAFGMEYQLRCDSSPSTASATAAGILENIPVVGSKVLADSAQSSTLHDDSLFDHLSVDATYAVCTAIAETWCDNSRMFLADRFVVGAQLVSKWLVDARVIGELQRACFGTAAESSKITAAIADAKHMVTSKMTLPPFAKSSSSTGVSEVTPPTKSNLHAGDAISSLNLSSSRRLQNEFGSIIRSIAKACRLLSGKGQDSIRAALQLLFLKVLVPFGAVSPEHSQEARELSRLFGGLAVRCRLIQTIPGDVMEETCHALESVLDVLKLICCLLVAE